MKSTLSLLLVFLNQFFMPRHNALNRPGFPRGFFVQKLGGIFKGVCLFVECVLHFLRRPMPDGTV